MAMMRFEDFAAGSVLGRHEETIDSALLAQWRAIFPEAPAAPSPGGFAMAFAMRAYLTILPERPPGNIHARQRLSVHRAIAEGDRVETTLSCVAKELRGDRRRLTLLAAAATAEGPLFDAEMTILWAA
jgi:hypothetical protein